MGRTGRARQLRDVRMAVGYAKLKGDDVDIHLHQPLQHSGQLHLCLRSPLQYPGSCLRYTFRQWAGFLLAASIALLGYDIIPCTLRELCELKGLKRFFRINGDIFLRTLCLVTVTIWFTRTGARQGEEMLAVNALLMQFFTLFSFFMDGFGFSGEALAGKYIGAKDPVHLA